MPTALEGPRSHRSNSSGSPTASLGRTCSLPDISRPQECLPGGGRTQGAKRLKPGQSSEFDIAKHGWYHPHGQAEQRRLYDVSQQGSFNWTLQKSKNHTGYGVDGRVNRGEVQGTAVSGDSPQWFTGPRTMFGPFSTRKVPVRRCPDLVMGDDDKMFYRAKTFRQGPGLETIEIWHDHCNQPPTPAARAVPNNPQSKVARCQSYSSATRNNLCHGGCTVLPCIRRGGGGDFERPAFLPVMA
mmetsp:Transcript_49773/g.106629  ORF Transcript_49773/g.106629 Transcript_49773/m.106629 type:complete len:241 (-) Transcript_49773:77-799(-)